MNEFDEHIFQMGWFNHQLVQIRLDNDKLHSVKKSREFGVETSEVSGWATCLLRAKFFSDVRAGQPTWRIISHNNP